MRYLWIEDFNDGSLVEEELRERLENFFDLKDDKLVVKRDLSSAISFLENREKIHEIDAVLIDIRFPEGEMQCIYEKYFSDIVTRKFYNKNIDDASGILLYLLLVFRYHISQKKIAFVSANISSDNSKLRVIYNMLEIIAKYNFEKEIDDCDIRSYYTNETYLARDELKISREDKSWDTFIRRTEDGEYEILGDVDIEHLRTSLRSLPLTYDKKFKEDDENTHLSSAQTKYNAVKVQFDKIGFAMPAAFEKPKGICNLNKSYSFLEWESSLYQDSYNAVRSNILEMCILLIEYLEENKEDTKLFSNFLKLLSCRSDEIQTYDSKFFIRYLRNFKGFFYMEIGDVGKVYCERVVKELTSLWEVSRIPKYRKDNYYEKVDMLPKERKFFCHKDHCNYACHATMKIVRNWVGHQGINDMNVLDIGLLFVIGMRGLFNISVLPAEIRDKYEICEKKLLNMFEKNQNVKVDINESFEYFCELNDKTMDGEQHSKEIYDRISGLGNSASIIRRMVSMDEIYMLLYHSLNKDKLYGVYSEIETAIRARTWESWKSRYNNRFGKHVTV